MTILKYAFKKEPAILVFLMIIICVSSVEYLNAYNVRRDAPKNRIMVLNTVAKLENIVEDVDRLEIKNSDVYRDGAKLELSPESQMVVVDYDRCSSEWAAQKIFCLTFGFDALALMLFALFCRFVYIDDEVDRQDTEIEQLNRVAERAYTIADKAITCLDAITPFIEKKMEPHEKAEVLQRINSLGELMHGKKGGSEQDPSTV